MAWPLEVVCNQGLLFPKLLAVPSCEARCQEKRWTGEKYPSMKCCPKSAPIMDTKLKVAYAVWLALIVAWIYCGWRWIQESHSTLYAYGDTPIFTSFVYHLVRELLNGSSNFDFDASAPPGLLFPMLPWRLMRIPPPEVFFLTQTTVVLATAWAVERIATHLYDRWSGLLASMIFLTSLYIDSTVRNFVCDPMVGLCLCWAYYASLQMRTRVRAIGPCIGFACWWCLAAFSKWPAIPMWLGLFTCYLLWRLLIWRREHKEEKYSRWLYGWKRWLLVVGANALSIYLAICSGWRLIIIMQLILLLGTLMVPKVGRWAQLERWVFYMSLACILVGVFYWHAYRSGPLADVVSRNANVLGADMVLFGEETVQVSLGQRLVMGLFSYIDFICKAVMPPCFGKLFLFSVVVSLCCRRFRASREMLWLILIPGNLLLLTCFVTFVSRYVMMFFGLCCVITGAVVRRVHVVLAALILLWLLAIKVIFVGGWLFAPGYFAPANRYYLDCDRLRTDCSVQFSRLKPEEINWGLGRVFLEHRHDWAEAYFFTGYPDRLPSLEKALQLWDDIGVGQYHAPVLYYGTDCSTPHIYFYVFNSYEDSHDTERSHAIPIDIKAIEFDTKQMLEHFAHAHYLLMLSNESGSLAERRCNMIDIAHKVSPSWRLVTFYPRPEVSSGFNDENDVALFYRR